MPKERQTCTECSMRRQKCDRNLPCGRCIKRGEADKCTREWKEGYDPKVHRVYPRSDKPNESTSPTPHEQTSTTQLDPVAERATTSLLTRSFAVDGATPLDSSETSSRARSNAPDRRPETETNAYKDGGLGDLLKVGQQTLDDYPLQQLPRIYGVKDSMVIEWEYSNGFGNSNSAQISFLQLLLPNRAQLFLLVDYHLRNLLWQHCSFHGPTFHAELRDLCSAPMGLQVRDMDLRWAALLFAVMAGSMACANDDLSSTWGFRRVEKSKLTKQWYKAAVACLNMADYMWRHHINSVSAICTMVVSAHILGFSNTQSTLLGAALKIAQGLGLQRLGEDSHEFSNNEATITLTSTQRERIIKREVGRRVWTQLCNQDWFSIPFSDMYSIQQLHFSTVLPENVDEQTMLPIPNHLPTQTSFERAVHDLAVILPQAHDAISSSSTLYTKYEQVLHYDSKIKAMSREGMPTFFSDDEPISPDWPDYIPWARRSLRLSFAHKIIMVHRSFLARSFTDSTFEFTRNSSMEAAKIILNEVKSAYEDHGPNLWIDQAFMVAAGITMSLDIFHRKPEEPEYVEHRTLVERAITVLGKLENSMIAQRGVRLLSSLLAEQAKLMAEKSIQNYRKRTRQHENDGIPTDSSVKEAPHFTHVGSGANKRQKQKFDVPKFVENFVGQDDGLTASYRASFQGRESNDTTTNLSNADFVGGNVSDQTYGNGQLGNLLVQNRNDRSSSLGMFPDIAAVDLPTLDLGYEPFEQMFPPHMGINNAFLFEDLLNFEV